MLCFRCSWCFQSWTGVFVSSGLKPLGVVVSLSSKTRILGSVMKGCKGSSFWFLFDIPFGSRFLEFAWVVWLPYPQLLSGSESDCEDLLLQFWPLPWFFQCCFQFCSYVAVFLNRQHWSSIGYQSHRLLCLLRLNLLWFAFLGIRIVRNYLTHLLVLQLSPRTINQF